MCLFLLERESVRHRLGYEHLGEYGIHEWNQQPNGCHDLQIWRGNSENHVRHVVRRDCAHYGRLALDGNEETDVHDLTESRHATSVGSSDEFLHVDRHYVGGGNVRCGGGEGLRGDVECRGYGESELHEHNGAP